MYTIQDLLDSSCQLSTKNNMKPYHKILIKMTIILIMIALQLFSSCKETESEASEQSQIKCIVSDLLFAEGPVYHNGSLYFSDIEANTIYKWNEIEGLTVFKSDLTRTNGLYFSPQGILYACEGGNKRIISIDVSKNVTAITGTFNGKQYNEPNDLWISSAGNIYFTDPNFTSTQTQDGQDVYCVLASTGEVIKVIGDLIKPNGIVGNTEGSLLYVADYGASKIYRYTISTNGTLSDKQIFASVQADGLTIDDEGNLYAASNAILKFNQQGVLSESISIEGTLTNLFYVKDGNAQMLFATTHNQVYQIEL